MTKVEVTYSYFPFSVRPLCTMVSFDKYHPEIIKFDFFQLKSKNLTELRIVERIEFCSRLLSFHVVQDDILGGYLGTILHYFGMRYYCFFSTAQLRKKPSTEKNQLSYIIKFHSKI